MSKKPKLDREMKKVIETFSGPGKIYWIELHNKAVIDFLDACRMEGENVEAELSMIVTDAILSYLKRSHRKMKRSYK